jgi:hypothetical protein
MIQIPGETLNLRNPNHPITMSEKKEESKHYLGKDYVCSQCGPDSNGAYVHQKMYHTFPPMTLEEAINDYETHFKLPYRKKPEPPTSADEQNEIRWNKEIAFARKHKL